MKITITANQFELLTRALYYAELFCRRFGVKNVGRDILELNNAIRNQVISLSNEKEDFGV